MAMAPGSSRQTRCLVALALAGLAAFPMVSAGGMVADVVALGFEADGAQAEGVLAALRHAESAGSGRLEATALEALLEEESAPTILNQTGGQVNYQGAAPVRTTYANVTAGRLELSPGSELYVLPLPGSAPPRLSSGPECVALGPSSERTVEPLTNVHTARRRHNESADVQRSLAWPVETCADAHWAVEGTFLLTLWEGNLTFSSTDGQADYRTGAHYPETTEVFGERANRQLFLSVLDGRLELDALGTAFLGEAVVVGQRFVVQGSQGQVDALEGPDLDGTSLDLRGDLTARLQGASQGRIQVQVTGTLDSGTLDGQAFALAQPGSSPRGWIAALALVPLVTGGGIAAWRRHPRVALARLERLSGSGTRLAVVASESRRLQRLADLGTEATALRVDALARTGRLGEALLEARRLPPMEAALALAYAFALAGDRPACRDALKACAAMDARWTRIAMRDPVLAAATADVDLGKGDRRRGRGA